MQSTRSRWGGGTSLQSVGLIVVGTLGRIKVYHVHSMTSLPKMVGFPWARDELKRLEAR